MPQVSTKNPSASLAETPDAADKPRVERARRRIGERYYDRPDVRRTLAALILHRVRRRAGK